jgi:L-fucose mutarotase/ribose pyranase (RbsD/FucU family)
LRLAAEFARSRHRGCANVESAFCFPHLRFSFMNDGKSAFAVAATAETKRYGCILLKKDVIRPE